MKRALILMLPLLLASCFAPKERDRGAGLPVIPAVWQAGGHEEREVMDYWWDSFNDPLLSSFIDEALARNFDLRAAVARLDAAAAEARIAGADLWPQAGGGFNATREQRNFIGFPIPGGQQQVLTTRSTRFGLSLNTSWELDLWGRVRAGKKAEQAEFMASAANLAGARQSLAAQTAKAWFSVVESRRQLSIAESTVRSFEITTAQVRQRYERGIRPPLDLRLALANVAGARALAEDRRARLERAVRQLEILLGRYPSGGLKSLDILPAVPPAIPAGLPAELLARRPDLVAAEKKLLAADWRIAQSKAALLPRISLTASGGTSSEDITDLLTRQFLVWSLAGNLAQPIFEGGRLVNGIDLSKARSREAVAEYQAAAMRAFAEVESALKAEQILARREKEVAEAVTQSHEALRLAQDRYLSGLEDFITVLESQRRALEAETQLAALKRERLDNRVDLHLALGGGFPSDRELIGAIGAESARQSTDVASSEEGKQ